MTTNLASKPSKLILASTSTYRRELLSRLCIPFEVIAPMVDETPQRDEIPQALASRLALAKSTAVAVHNPDAWVIGSDQVVNLKGECLGKPGTHENAVAQLKRLQGQEVYFETAVALVCVNQQKSFEELVRVRVEFRVLSTEAIVRYLKAETPYDCAGSAKSEGLGISLLECIENKDPTALIGLPLIATCKMLRAAGFEV
jgi:septum formation protein